MSRVRDFLLECGELCRAELGAEPAPANPRGQLTRTAAQDKSYGDGYSLDLGTMSKLVGQQVTRGAQNVAAFYCERELKTHTITVTRVGSLNLFQKTDDKRLKMPLPQPLWLTLRLIADSRQPDAALLYFATEEIEHKKITLFKQYDGIVALAASTIPAAGCGVYALSMLRQGVPLMRFTGKVKEFDINWYYEGNPNYAMRAERRAGLHPCVIDPTDNKDPYNTETDLYMPGHFVNGKTGQDLSYSLEKDTTPVNLEAYSVPSDRDEEYLVLCSSTNIPAYTELFFDYGWNGPESAYPLQNAWNQYGRDLYKDLLEPHGTQPAADRIDQLFEHYGKHLRDEIQGDTDDKKVQDIAEHPDKYILIQPQSNMLRLIENAGQLDGICWDADGNATNRKIDPKKVVVGALLDLLTIIEAIRIGAAAQEHNRLAMLMQLRERLLREYFEGKVEDNWFPGCITNYQYMLASKIDRDIQTYLQAEKLVKRYPPTPDTELDTPAAFPAHSSPPRSTGTMRSRRRKSSSPDTPVRRLQFEDQGAGGAAGAGGAGADATKESLCAGALTLLF